MIFCLDLRISWSCCKVWVVIFLGFFLRYLTFQADRALKFALFQRSILPVLLLRRKFNDFHGAVYLSGICIKRARNWSLFEGLKIPRDLGWQNKILTFSSFFLIVTIFGIFQEPREIINQYFSHCYLFFYFACPPWLRRSLGHSGLQKGQLKGGRSTGMGPWYNRTPAPRWRFRTGPTN